MGDIRQVEQWYKMNRAKNLDQWLRAMEMMSVPCFNSGYADREGNILYLYNSKIPLRSGGYNWKLPVPGNTEKTLWKEYISFNDLPMVKNPPSGYIQNCNSTPFQTTTGPGNPDPDKYPPEMGIETHLTNRAMRARELFGPDPSVTREEFYRYKYDMKYSQESHMASYLEQAGAFEDIPAELKEAHNRLLAWDLGTEPDNTRTALAVLTFQELIEKEQDRLTRNEYVTRLRKAKDVLEEHHGSPDVPWKKVNRIIRGDVNMGMGGGPDILHAVYGDLREDGTLKGHTGDSLVMLVRWDRKGRVSSRSIHQYGSATSDPASPHYADQVPLFVKREMKDVLMDKEEIMKNLEREYRPGEEK
jgi:penicillin amidase/acyl-homoserine-lactone acylase